MCANFGRNFTRLLNSVIHSIPHFVEIYLKLTNLYCSSNHHNHRLHRTKHASRGTAADLNPMVYRVWGNILKKYHKLQPSRRQLMSVMSWKSPWTLSFCHKNNKPEANFTKLWLSVGCQRCNGVNDVSSICSNSIHLHVCILISSPTS